MLFEAHNKQRALKIALQMKDFIKKDDRVLDIGLGNGYVAKKIKGQFQVHMEGVDVVDYNETDIKNTIYDGLHLPFKEKSFDCCLILQTLHHCTYQIQVLKEARRVSRRTIIIMEDVYNNKFEKLMTFMHDYISNKRKGVDCPYYFHNKKEWKEIFDRLGLKIEKEIDTVTRYLFLKFNNVAYVLNV
ncbi:class I SAM-dependent methyltransferase [Candidatus Woesearchaeota archaeon]|nr:class I SAM-dependent methyltransferase [Candidatus Woesearchaeota archaeon]